MSRTNKKRALPSISDARRWTRAVKTTGSTEPTTNTMERVCLKHDLVLYGDEACGECAQERAR